MTAKIKNTGWLLLIVIVLALHTIATTAATGTKTGGRQHFTITGITQADDSEWAAAEGDYDCILFGTWGGATADVETRIQGPGDIKNIGTAAFVGATADTTWQATRLGAGEYRVEVTGGDGTTSLTFHCRRVRG